MECALNDRPAGGWVFPTRTLEDHGSSVLVASATLTEASALLCGWERAPRPSPVKGKHTRCPGKGGQLCSSACVRFVFPPTLTVCIIASSFYDLGGVFCCFWWGIFVVVFCFIFWWWWLFLGVCRNAEMRLFAGRPALQRPFLGNFLISAQALRKGWHHFREVDSVQKSRSRGDKLRVGVLDGCGTLGWSSGVMASRAGKGASHIQRPSVKEMPACTQGAHGTCYWKQLFCVEA